MSTPQSLFRTTSTLARLSYRTQPSQPRYRTRTFTTTPPLLRQTHRKASFASRLGTAWRRTPIKYKPIPIALGATFLAVFQFYRIQERERRNQERAWLEEHQDDYGEAGDLAEAKKKRRRERVRPSGPWSVQIMSTLPLKFLSRLWGKFNEVTIPYYLRVPGFKLYGYIFGVDFSEVAEEDLHTYRNLAEFFYRTLKPGVRPLDGHPNALLSPADGRVVQFGYIEHGEVEQVKGVTYSVDALLGSQPGGGDEAQKSSSLGQQSHREGGHGGDPATTRADEEFARVNGISYSLPNLFSGGNAPTTTTSTASGTPSASDREGGRTRPGSASSGSAANAPPSDQSTTSTRTSEAEVSASLAPASKPWYYPSTSQNPDPDTTPTGLYYCVVYLAPGDYHRFHSPVSWVVSSRRHFAGELFSVSPYLQRTLPGLFTLNERVCLLGRWKYGFFSFTPVGATNVGSIIINFDRELRTNSLLTDTLADLAAAKAAKDAEREGEKVSRYPGYAEATYAASSPVLGGHALRRGEEMGGFQLGSTIVLVFEAPKGRRPSFDEGWSPGDSDGGNVRKGGWRWCIERGMKVKVGERLGFVAEEEEEQ